MDIQASQYHDLKGLSALRLQARESTEDAIAPVARQFEALFLQMMLKSMRDTVPESGLWSDQATGFYEDMLDSELSVSLSEKGGVGLAEMLTRQLSHQEGGEAAAPVSASGESLRNSLLQNRIKDFQTSADKL